MSISACLFKINRFSIKEKQNKNVYLLEKYNFLTYLYD